MVYAASANSGKKQDKSKTAALAAAIWHIFPPSATPRVNAYLRRKYHSLGVDDPINRQLFYLSDDDLAQLNTPQWGLTRSFRILQEPGDAVLIPAGCAHQVANGRSSIKVAVDFVTPERIHLCATIMTSFRDLAAQYRYPDPEPDEMELVVAGKRVTPQALAKKEDVLQLYDCLFFAWFQIAAAAKRWGLEKTGMALDGGDEEGVAQKNKNMVAKITEDNEECDTTEDEKVVAKGTKDGDEVNDDTEEENMPTNGTQDGGDMDTEDEMVEAIGTADDKEARNDADDKKTAATNTENGNEDNEQQQEAAVQDNDTDTVDENDEDKENIEQSIDAVTPA